MTDGPQHPAIEAVNNALKERTFSQGRIQVSSDKLLLFYSKRQEEKAGTAHFLNLGDASETSLRDLCDACDAAGFGLGNQNTFDETYRKSKKLDTTQFSSDFDVRTTNILDQVQSDLVEGQDEIKIFLRSELYKLNVYCEGDFFQAHKDTPRAENMMGSLVIVGLENQGQLEPDYLDTELQRCGTLISTTEYWASPPRTHEGSTALPEIAWVTPLTTINRMNSNYLAYGKEPSIGYLYGDVCLMVKVGKPGNRAA
ncbi:hypothetical protein EV421DRAFT_1910625 [Armillaria borealis]|uniref:Prolyl 4-hydroxylase alpha subunit Fe(2+) 2OG dioxygenase domain-containing protein n=1 Tax=Armillaria borealis TaxID=47425 RepID=A0AA39IYD4_9AGAR|nr:hypothetical protein EV421DRAFT_1910625 [Armillaria borealis]